MKILTVNREETRALLSMKDCIPLMEQALATLARGHGLQPLRPVMWLPDRSGALGMMPGHLGEDFGMMGVKVISVFPGNRELDSHQGFVLLFDTGDGRPVALVDGSEITAIRTAAVSAVATKLLALADAGELAVLGSGAQAESHLAAMAEVRPLRCVRVWSRNPDHAAGFAARCASRYPFPFEVFAEAEQAVRGASIVCTTTASAEPVLLGDWLEPGAHINAVGACVKHMRELDTAAVVKSRLFVDRRESAFHESGDFLIPRAEGAIGDDHLAGEIGEALIGKVRGRTDSGEITLFKSLGLAVEDVAAAQWIYRRALETGKGTWLPWGAPRHA